MDNDQGCIPRGSVQMRHSIKKSDQSTPLSLFFVCAGTSLLIFDVLVILHYRFFSSFCCSCTFFGTRYVRSSVYPIPQGCVSAEYTNLNSGMKRHFLDKYHSEPYRTVRKAALDTLQDHTGISVHGWVWFSKPTKKTLTSRYTLQNTI